MGFNGSKWNGDGDWHWHWDRDWDGCGMGVGWVWDGRCLAQSADVQLAWIGFASGAKGAHDRDGVSNAALYQLLHEPTVGGEAEPVAWLVASAAQENCCSKLATGSGCQPEGKVESHFLRAPFQDSN